MKHIILLARSELERMRCGEPFELHFGNGVSVVLRLDLDSGAPGTEIVARESDSQQQRCEPIKRIAKNTEKPAKDRMPRKNAKPTRKYFCCGVARVASSDFYHRQKFHGGQRLPAPGTIAREQEKKSDGGTKNREGKFRCDCGREFESQRKLGAHRWRCPDRKKVLGRPDWVDPSVGVREAREMSKMELDAIKRRHGINP